MSLFSNSEGRVLLLGVALVFAYTLWLGFELLWSPAEAQILIGATATAVVFGRAAGLAFGYSASLSPLTVILISVVAETASVLIVYPLFVFSWRHLLVLKPLQKTFTRIHEAAETHKAGIQRYGVIGLFAFVWFPFWMTGPVVGCVLGFLLGLPVWLNLTVVLAGTYVAILGWALFLREVHTRVFSSNPYAAMALVVFLIVLVVVGYILRRARRENRHKP
ncbi:MAG: small multi-drug export protein [Sedimentisphaerales bacterium]|nr:small multi-drug export protein [Sedimentisphaerales bacterium]